MGWTGPFLAFRGQLKGRAAVWPGLPIRPMALGCGWRRRGADWHPVRDSWSWLGSARQRRQAGFLVLKCLPHT